MEFEKKEILISGKKVFYLEKGKKLKKTIVLLHGYPGNYETLLDLARKLGNRYRIVMPNFPSCGGSEPFKDDYNIKAYVEWLELFLKGISVKKATLIGHSFGARVALVFSIVYPKKIERLVLIAPVLRPDSPFKYILMPKYKIAKFLPAYASRAFLSSKIFEYVACKVVSMNPEQQRNITRRGVVELQYVYPKAHVDLFEEFYNLDLTPLGKQIKAKTLVIAGKQDRFATLDAIEIFAGQIKKGVLKVAKNSGHLLPTEHPEIAAAFIKDWILV
jgi:pimeloyl-ACP methyl ester carboxylesterase